MYLLLIKFLNFVLYLGLHFYPTVTIKFAVAAVVVIMAARQLCWPSTILFYRCGVDLSFLSLRRR